MMIIVSKKKILRVDSKQLCEPAFLTRSFKIDERATYGDFRSLGDIFSSHSWFL